MKIVQLDTIRLEAFPNLLWLQLSGEDGTQGLGETFFLPGTVEACVHEHLAPRVLGLDSQDLELIRSRCSPYVGYSGSGAEMRALSALDIALWDLNARAAGLPLAVLLGGYARHQIRTYNTCAGPIYMRSDKGQVSDNYGIRRDAASTNTKSPAQGALEALDDLNAFLHHPGELARALLDEGITGMKVWPFDEAAERTGGLDISAQELRRGAAVLEGIRAAVGDEMDIMLELHGMWHLTPAIRIAQALAEFKLYWIEDPLRPVNADDLRRFADASPAPLCASETLHGLSGFRPLLERQAPGFVMLDLSWCGGVSEARRIAALAQAWQLPVTPHDCTGPVVLAASTHLALHAPNAVMQESVRAYLRTWYAEVAEGLPTVTRGQITVANATGHGVRLRPDLEQRFTAKRRSSRMT